MQKVCLRFFCFMRQVCLGINLACRAAYYNFQCDTRQCIQSAISNWSTTILLNTSMIPFCLLFLIPQLFSPPTMFTWTISTSLMIISMVRPAPSLFIPPISMHVHNNKQVQPSYEDVDDDANHWYFCPPVSSWQ